MATFRNASSVSSSGATVSVTKPTGVVQDDVQLLYAFCDQSGVTLGVTGGAAWTQVGSTQNVTNGDTATCVVFRQVAGASEPASYSVSNSASSATSVIIVAYSGCDTSTPIAAQLATNPNSASPPASPVSIAANAITTTASSQTVVFFAGVDWNSSTAAAFTDPASTTRRAVETPAQFSSGLACDFVQVSAGTTGTITGTGTLAAASGNYVAWLIALDDATNIVGATPGTWSWAGSPARLTGLADTAFQQNAFQSDAFQIFGGTTSGGPTTLSATPGAWSWAGSTATFPVPQVAVTPGTWTWAGSTQAFTQLINATPGAWTWAGSTQTTTQLINQVTGGWTWAGSAQTLTQLINATPGAWTWAGSTQTTTQLINAAVGAWTWAGSTQGITTPGGVTTIDSTPGNWTWVGSTAEIPTQISAITGTWIWAGSNATATQLINAIPGAFTWAGSTATTSQVFNATPGLWSWAGSVQGIVSQVTIDATPGNWTWAGSQSGVISLDTGNIPAGGSGGYEHEAAIIRYRRALFRRQQEAENAAKAKAEATEAQQRLAAANTKRQREKEARVIEKLRRQEDKARTLEEQLIAEIGLLQSAIFGANAAAQQTAIQAEEEEFALMFALTTLI